MPQRYDSLDVLRGIAILGILVMNMQAFAMPWPAYANPHAYGSLEGIHGWVYSLSHLFFDTKFYSLFALMFGAGIALMAERSLAGGRPAAGSHYRRMLVLGLIGLLHGFLLWFGDILFIYAVCGSLAYLFLRRRIRTLLIAGVIFALIPSVLGVLNHAGLDHAPPEVQQELATLWASDSPEIQKDLNAYQGSWAEQQSRRASTFLQIIGFEFFGNLLWQALGLMLIGIALYRSGFLTLQWQTRHYATMAGAGLLLGLGLTLWGMVAIEARDWAFPWTRLIGLQFNQLGAPLAALGYASLVMLACRHPGFLARVPALKAVGQTALSNYLLQTLICTTLFYGHGLGLFGEVERAQQLLLVLLIWTVQLPLSLWWVRRFHHGPVEWLWRAASRLERPPFKRSVP